MDFKVSYLDAGLTNTYFSDSDQLFSGSSSNQFSSTSTSATQQSQSQTATKSTTPQRVNRRYKTQLRDFLSTCRTKRKINSHHQPVPIAHPTPTTPTVDYIPSADPAAAAAVAVAYSNLNTMYPSTYSTPAATADNGLSGYMGHTSNFHPHHHHHHHQSLYDNRLPYLATTDNLFHQYRPLTNYYPDYHSAAATTPYVSNGFLDISSRGSPSSLPTYDAGAASHHHMAPVAETKLNDCDKMYGCSQPLLEQKYVDTSRYVGVGNATAAAAAGNAAKCVDLPNVYMPTSVAASTSCDVQASRNMSGRGMKPPMEHAAPDHSPVTAAVNGILAPKMEDVKLEALQQHYSPLPPEAPRQTVLMWALNHTPQSSSSGRSPTTTETGSNASTPPVLINGASSVSHHYLTATPPVRDNKKSPTVAQSYGSNDPLKSLAEMNSMSVGVAKWKPETPPSPKTYYHHQHQYASDGGTAEVWPPHHQFYPYHHHQ